MSRATIIAKLQAAQGELRKRGVRSLALFGSAARDEARRDSDIDVLADFAQPLTFDRYMDVKFYLEDLLRRPVDLVPRGSLRPRLRSVVERELIDVT